MITTFTSISILTIIFPPIKILTHQNYEIPMIFLINRRISQDAESPGQHSVVCTVNSQSVCNEACHYTNKHLLYLMKFLQVIKSVSQNVQLCVCLFICLTDWKRWTWVYITYTYIDQNNIYSKLALLNHC